MAGHLGKATVLITGQVPVTRFVLGIKYGTRERAFKAKRRDDDFTPNAAHFALWKIPMMTRGQPIHHFGFSGRTDFNRLAVFYRPYFFDNFRAFDQQILNLIINAVDFLAYGE